MRRISLLLLPVVVLYIQQNGWQFCSVLYAAGINGTSALLLLDGLASVGLLRFSRAVCAAPRSCTITACLRVVQWLVYGNKSQVICFVVRKI